ncbi:protein-tyrosine-phosphatase [Bombilactobacillus bombi]|uniref:Protein-tyrosine-phosphatase n=1 Tax=Bombilactobacillus bombi TaxID=1303590 RepID=A0A3R7CQI3_9LACO|nr:tyrosine-protein phosphatase [Bombilactobacillus bombi]RHW52108.1 protein-tyrosine-phosphatase [Bombilactobacillus bombi]
MKNNRLLNLEAGRNFRELGGYQTKDGNTIKYHKIIRSASLGQLTDHDLNFLTDYGLKYDIDFRSADEQQKVPDRVPEHVEYLFDPVFGVDLTQASKFDDQEKAATPDHNIEGLADIPSDGHENMCNTYRELIHLDSAKKAYRIFFDKLLENNQADQVLLFHCTAGKDRTGMGAVFFMTALGVDRQTILNDYLMTNEVTKDFVEEQLQPFTNNPLMYDSVKALMQVSPDYLKAADEEVKKEAGSWINYLQTQIKVTDQEIADLKKIYLQ